MITFGNENLDIEMEGIRVYYIKQYDFPIKALTILIKYFNAYLRIKAIFKKENPHIVHHVSGGDYLSLITGIISKRKKIPSMVKFAGDLVWEKTVANFKTLPKYEDIFSFNLRARFLKRLQRYILTRFECIIATSSFQMESLLGAYRIRPEKIVRLPNFINTTHYDGEAPKEETGDKVQILNVCRFARWKRLDLCIQVFSKLNDQNLELKIVGGGNPLLEKELRNLCRDLNIEGRVIFVGEVSPTEISRHFCQADIFFSTTAYEPFGIVFVEAMAAGLPIVAPRVGGISDIVCDGAGFLVDPDDLDGMAEKLKLLIEDKTLRKEMGEKGKNRARVFDSTRNVDAVFALYRHLLSNGRNNTHSDLPLSG